MNIKLLQHFVSVYDNLSLTKAAQTLGVTQSNISKSIQKLENELELLLFHRHSRNLKPTEAAKDLYKNACQCLSATDDFISKARYLSHGNSGALKVGCGPLAYDLLLKPLISQLITQEENIRIHAGTGNFNELKHQLDNHLYDCLLYDVGELQQITDPSDYQVIPLIKTPVYIVANQSHPIHKQKNAFESIFTYRWVLPPIPQRYIGSLPYQFQEYILNSDKPDFEVTDLYQALDLAERNNLITIMAGDLNDNIFSKRSLKPVKLPFTIYSDIGLWRLRSRYMTPIIKKVITVLEMTIPSQ